MKFQRDALVALLVGSVFSVVAQVRLERKLNAILAGERPAPESALRRGRLRL